MVRFAGSFVHNLVTSTILSWSNCSMVLIRKYLRFFGREIIKKWVFLSLFFSSSIPSYYCYYYFSKLLQLTDPFKVRKLACGVWMGRRVRHFLFNIQRWYIWTTYGGFTIVLWTEGVFEHDAETWLALNTLCLWFNYITVIVSWVIMFYRK